MNTATPGRAPPAPEVSQPASQTAITGRRAREMAAMTSSDTPVERDRVDDPNGLLEQDDHMRDMERQELEV